MLNPKQQAFLEAYLDPDSDTWSNAYKSALKAGYEESYAERITTENLKWLEDAQDDFLVRKASKNLQDFLSQDKNETIKWDASKFTLTKLNKKFKDKQEIELKGLDLTKILKQIDGGEDNRTNKEIQTESN